MSCWRPSGDPRLAHRWSPARWQSCTHACTTDTGDVPAGRYWKSVRMEFRLGSAVESRRSRKADEVGGETTMFSVVSPPGEFPRLSSARCCRLRRGEHLLEDVIGDAHLVSRADRDSRPVGQRRKVT